MSKSFGVLGSPIEHSKSPAIHRAAYRVLGEEWEYSINEVSKDVLRNFLNQDNKKHSGFSLTMPLKEAAFQIATQSDDLSKITKASNTLVRHEDGWHAFNTDIFGVYQAVSLNKSGPINLSLIIGSGATATSALVALAKLSPGSRVKIYARNASTRAELISLGSEIGLSVSRALFLANGIRNADLTISTVPGGALDPLVAKLSKKKRMIPSGLLLDVAYHPWPSKLSSIWTKAGIPVVGGIEMLIWQAVAQIRIFKFGNPEQILPNEIAVVEAMRIAVEQ
jgi:shikimate dehydrogenase